MEKCRRLNLVGASAPFFTLGLLALGGGLEGMNGLLPTALVFLLFAGILWSVERNIGRTPSGHFLSVMLWAAYWGYLAFAYFTYAKVIGAGLMLPSYVPLASREKLELLAMILLFIAAEAAVLMVMNLVRVFFVPRPQTR